MLHPAGWLSKGGDGARSTIRAVSYNIWNINGHDQVRGPWSVCLKSQGSYFARAKLLGKLLLDADADIVALQEVLRRCMLFRDFTKSTPKHIHILIYL